jgi:transcriptional regulator with XRE-family HTH domain
LSFLSARLKAGLSQAVVAEKLGISAPSVSQWETGKTMPKTDKLMEIAALYDCSVEELLSPDESTS